MCRHLLSAIPCLPPPQDDLEMEVDSWLRRKFEGSLKEVEVVHREDLDLVRAAAGRGQWLSRDGVGVVAGREGRHTVAHG